MYKTTDDMNIANELINELDKAHKDRYVAGTNFTRSSSRNAWRLLNQFSKKEDQLELARKHGSISGCRSKLHD